MIRTAAEVPIKMFNKTRAVNCVSAIPLYEKDIMGIPVEIPNKERYTCILILSKDGKSSTERIDITSLYFGDNIINRVNIYNDESLDFNLVDDVRCRLHRVPDPKNERLKINKLFCEKRE